MEAIKLCRLDTPIIFIEARINLSRFVVTGCAAKTSEIGRASCRERVYGWVDCVALIESRGADGEQLGSGVATRIHRELAAERAEIVFFFKQKTAYEIGLSIPAEPLFRSGSDKTLQVGYANHFYRSAHKFEQICRHRLRRQNVGYSNFSQPQSHLSFCVLLQYLVERRRVVTQLGKLD